LLTSSEHVERKRIRRHIYTQPSQAAAILVFVVVKSVVTTLNAAVHMY
jgi:hypothetical protein